MKFNIKALAVVVTLSAGVAPVFGGVAVAAETGVTVELSQSLASVVRAAATNPAADVALAQIRTLIADNPTLADQIAVLAASLRPEIAVGVAQAAAVARPDAAARIFAAVDAAAPGQGVAEFAKDFDQARGGPMNAGAGPQGSAPMSSRQTGHSFRSESTVLGNSISGK